MSVKPAKEIRAVTLKANQLNKQFGNPRKIGKKKLDELKQSFELFGDFGVFVIDENYSIIAGNQRHTVVMAIDPEREILCKMLVGYSEAERRAINIKDNTHSGEWDLDLLADWTADLGIDLAPELDNKNQEDRAIKEMEPIQYEKYDYVVIVCRNELDYNSLVRKLGIEGAKVKLGEKKTIRSRAVWYEDAKL